MNNFDEIALSYHNSIRKLPEKYIDLVLENFNLEETSNILDVGCGSGTLTIPLSYVSPKIDAIDLSKKMIDIGKHNDKSEKISWILGDAESQNFPKNYYDLVIGFESMHLFQNAKTTIEKLIDSIQNNGFICLGYAVYNWEKFLYKDIICELIREQINIDEWFFQCFSDFENLILMHENMKTVYKKCIRAEEKWSASDIAQFITSTSLFLSIDDSRR